jgi:hypothetical protein
MRPAGGARGAHRPGTVTLSPRCAAPIAGAVPADTAHPQRTARVGAGAAGSAGGVPPADSGVSGSPGALLAAAVQQRLAQALEPAAAGLAAAA